ncbi:uncharacterized protein LOC133711154 [Rosa rugosa]|uniref:uncharacterized protein LOC133711154 n=1 Tax=Rosa rugosa TaxID=74645 RepID=UPI002B4122FC|nr:uncharacterized protein LOC133711154 [Rosa rugosa]
MRVIKKKTLMDKLHVLLSEEEAFWRQRAKVQWLKEGDSNTCFFHLKAANRKRKNVIHGLYDENGVWRDDDKGMEQIVTSYFTQMFTASPIDMEAMHHTLEAIQPCVLEEMNSQLCRNYTEEEIREALFQMYPTKSPGPDGMPPLFFQHYWDTIGKDVTEAVQNFLHTGNLLKQVNFTHICLILKVSNPERMSDLRPIDLCNVIYKICSKAIANKLKIILPSIISPFQSAFVSGRLITDNILVANEVAHFVHNKREGQEGVMALKLDLSKAYDRMEWFFSGKGKPRGYVSPRRGLRQGDPLSPYLFLIGAEGFSALLQKNMLYAQASLEACYEIQDVIETYGRASGQLGNFNKSSVVFSKNVHLELQEEVSSLLGVEVVESHERYLGLPTYVGIKKMATFQYIKDNLAKKLKGFGGEAQRIKEKYIGKHRMLFAYLKKKEAWRVISAPASLIARVYKAKYFPEGSFWSVTAHNAPSYSWRSIFATRELLKAGSYLQIGSGTKLQVNDNLTVNELMRAQGVWHEERVRALFNGAEAEAILAIPLSTRQVDDRLVWKLENRGSFTVKTAYRFAYSNSIERVNVLGNGTSCFWKKIWHARILNTTKVTIWKICQNILPTKDRLVPKQVQIESQSCVLCDDNDETILHLCRNCSYSRLIIGSNLILRQTCFTSATDEMTAVAWLNYCSTRLDATHFSLLIFLLWSVWKERNCRVWDGKTKNACDVVLMATSRLKDYIFHNQKRMEGARQSETVTKWRCPPSGCVKINVDGAFNPQTKTGGTGLVFKDAFGHLLTGIGRPLVGLLSTEHAELLACKCAVEFIIYGASYSTYDFGNGFFGCATTIDHCRGLQFFSVGTCTFMRI